MIDFSQQEQQAKEFFSLLASKSNILIDLHYINHQALLNRSINKKLVIKEAIKFKEAYRYLKNDNAFWKNKMRQENVYFSFNASQNGFNIATVDDIERIDEFKAKNHFILIQTSAKKHQAFFLLDEYVNANDLAKIQKTLQVVYGGDKAATGAYQLKRVSGFINTKYGDNFIVKIISKGDRVLNAKKLLKHYEEHINIKPKPMQKLQIKSDKKVKAWSDFFKDDPSSADFSFALYLLHFFDEEQAKEILKKESKDLESRKGAYVDDYIERTISKALDVFDKIS